MLLKKYIRQISKTILSRKLFYMASKSINYSDVDPYKIKRPVYSFAAGPAPLPYPVMLNVKD
jgi:hypothetical protein